MKTFEARERKKDTLHVYIAANKKTNKQEDWEEISILKELYSQSKREKIKRKLIFSHVKRLRLRHKMLLCQLRGSLY